jgi:hypothetical protein
VGINGHLLLASTFPRNRLRDGIKLEHVDKKLQIGNLVNEIGLRPREYLVLLEQRLSQYLRSQEAQESGQRVDGTNVN